MVLSKVMDAKTKQEKRIKPDLPGGFRDYGHSDTIAKQDMMDSIRRTFESFGFDPLQTASVQRTEVLTGGDEDSGKIIFNVKGSRDEESSSSLRFDLTVPLARFLAAHPEVPKQFKRYQIGTVWRGESPQAGRYREFIQADVDIVGTASIDADLEIVLVLYTALKELGIENFTIAYNNRKILNALPKFAGFPEEKLWGVLRSIDKMDKIGKEKVLEEIGEEFGNETSGKIDTYLEQDMSTDMDFIAICDGLKMLKIDVDTYFVQKTSLVRGLSYYTGMVVEATLTDAPEIGSIGGGGRYDDLVTQFTGQSIAAVGVSIGVDRLFAALEKLGILQKKTTKTHVLIMQLSESLSPEYLKMAQELRKSGINTALYLGEDRTFQAQLAYAVKKEIPFVVIYGPDEAERGVIQIKNLKTREQTEVPKEKVQEFLTNQKESR